MNNYIEVIFSYINDSFKYYINDFLKWSDNYLSNQTNIFGINPDEDTLEDY
jgi:hypothetical protein